MRSAVNTNAFIKPGTMAIMVIKKYAGALPICEAKSAYHGIESQMDRPIQDNATSNAMKNLNLTDIYMPLPSLELSQYILILNLIINASKGGIP
jgi:hypothetical protein